MESVVDPTGAGDSFAGGFMGYLIANKSKDLLNDIQLLKESILMGSIMGTFAIEAFGTDKLFETTKLDIMNRFELYKKMLSV